MNVQIEERRGEGLSRQAAVTYTHRETAYHGKGARKDTHTAGTHTSTWTRSAIHPSIHTSIGSRTRGVHRSDLHTQGSAPPTHPPTDPHATHRYVCMYACAMYKRPSAQRSPFPLCLSRSPIRPAVHPSIVCPRLKVSHAAAGMQSFPRFTTNERTADRLQAEEPLGHTLLSRLVLSCLVCCLLLLVCVWPCPSLLTKPCRHLAARVCRDTLIAG
uniref:Uncharacterized protein n=1 Tax=Vitrella brassicaformis TaxID=1169539 RepID=A0A7S1PAB1_9ALVE|mmetsp:Transcript_45721/g.113597  ORF Transcript_45721/g.113597 Transcript_45721/m.113597 type:complete len:215 (+) Transcript_45721:245-889(+)